MKDILLPGVPGSEEFMQAYAMAFAALSRAKARSRREAHRTRHE
jgi:hypothetical protein